MRIVARLLELKSVEEAACQLERMGCDPGGVRIMAPKAIFRTILLENISSRAANLLKQTFLAKGGEVAVTRGTADLSVETTPVLICATMKHFRTALSQLRMQPWGLPDVAAVIESVLAVAEGNVVRHYQWKDCRLHIEPGHTLVMGILNLTPDSFSDGGKFNTASVAMEHVRAMIADGADIIDVGAESTRPYGAAKISADEELSRLLPVLEEVLRVSTVPVSVDTYKASVASEALRMGAHMINDIWGLQGDPDMAATVARFDVPVVVMHNRSSVEAGLDVLADVASFFSESFRIAEDNGIERQKLIVDPGFGFGKTIAQNLTLLRDLSELSTMGCPLLVGTSRKKFIGETLGLPVDDRLEGTGATVCQAISGGAHIVRVHDVKPMKRMVQMMDAMLGRGESHGSN